jgi:hypothetical protein
MATVARRRELGCAAARWQLQHEAASCGTLLESFTLGWLNLVGGWQHAAAGRARQRQEASPAIQQACPSAAGATFFAPASACKHSQRPNTDSGPNTKQKPAPGPISRTDRARAVDTRAGEAPGGADDGGRTARA